MSVVPEGFVVLDETESFRGFIGPIYLCDRAGVKTFGLRLEKRHCNINGMAHGGLLAALSDIVLTYTLASNRTPFVAPLTLSLNTEYIGTVGAGEWIEARATITKGGGSINFAGCEIRSGEKLLSQTSGVFKF